MSTRFFQHPIAIKLKEKAELGYWKMMKRLDKDFGNAHYKEFYTQFFSLSENFYQEKVILDIGCGPRGSLEWAVSAKERYGLDPLADSYLKLGADKHQMSYVKAYVEDMPFEKEKFDVVCSFNSLDHVSDLNRSCKEIQRVLKPGGLFLLLVDVHRMPTPTEPQRLKWDFVETFFEGYKVLEARNLNQVKKGRIYTNVRLGSDKGNNPKGSGVLVAKLQKPWNA
jgi:ubiquinone/menaquinone biosynthesis C-methylase UbiE